MQANANLSRAFATFTLCLSAADPEADAAETDYNMPGMSGLDVVR